MSRGKDVGEKLPLLTLTLEPLVDEAVEQGSTVVAESGRGVGVKSEPVLRSHRLPILQRLKQRLFLENVLGGRLGFFGFQVSRGWLHRAIYGTCLLLTLYRGESYTYTGDLSTEELTLLKAMVTP